VIKSLNSYKWSPWKPRWNKRTKLQCCKGSPYLLVRKIKIKLRKM